MRGARARVRRMDLAGPLMGNLFRQKFAQLRKEVQRYLQKKVRVGPGRGRGAFVTCRQVEANKPFSIHLAVDHLIITGGLQSALGVARACLRAPRRSE